MTIATRSTAVNRPHFTTGMPRPGGRLARFVAEKDGCQRPIIEDGLAYVTVEGHKHRRAVLDAQDFARITSRKAGSPNLTRSRWWLDEEGHLRAYSLRGADMFVAGVLVAAAVLDAQEGDTIELPSDPFDVRLSQLKRM